MSFENNKKRIFEKSPKTEVVNPNNDLSNSHFATILLDRRKDAVAIDDKTIEKRQKNVQQKPEE